MKSKSTSLKILLTLVVLMCSLIAGAQTPQWIWNSPLVVSPTFMNVAGISAYALINMPGKIYYVLVTYNDIAPTVDQIRQGKAHIGAALKSGNLDVSAIDYKSGYKSFQISGGLSASTDYDLYFLGEAIDTSKRTAPTKIHVTTTPGTGFTMWNGNFEQWNDSLTMPLYYFNWNPSLGYNNAKYSRDPGESGYGLKTTITNAGAAQKIVLQVDPDPFPYGFEAGKKYYISLRLKASTPNAFSVTYIGYGFYSDFAYQPSGAAAQSPMPLDTLKSTDWTTYTAYFSFTTANRMQVRWNINKTASAHNGDYVIIDNFSIKDASLAPLWYNNTPAVSNIKFNQFDLSAELDEEGTVFYVLVPGNAPAPSVSEVKAGTASGGQVAVKNGTINVAKAFTGFSATITGLSASTDYDIYLVAQNKESTPVVQSSTTKLSLTTAVFPGPTAHAGGTIWAESGYTVNLDGTASTGTQPLTYLWTAPGAITLSSDTARMPSFTAPSITDTVTYKIVLVVNDGTYNSFPDTAIIHVVQDYKPVADAGGNKSVNEGDDVFLDGSNSKDPNGKNLMYHWTISPGITVSNADTVVLKFKAPSPVDTTVYNFILQVNDGKLNSDPDTAKLTVIVANLKPVANAGSPQIVNAGDNVVLDGKASSDPNLDNLTYHWTVPAGVTVSNTDTVVLKFKAPSPAKTTVYPFVLVVNDGLLNSDPDTVRVTVAVGNLKPVAHAGNPQTVNAGANVTLDGSSSSDPNFDILTYHWTVPAGVVVSNADTVVLKFTAPSPATTTVYPFILVVNDGLLDSNPDTVKITVTGTVGIKTNNLQEIRLYPNPVGNELNVRLNGNWSSVSNVRMYNAIGVLALERKMSGHEYSFDLSSLPNGIYFIDISDGTHMVNRKLIKK